MEKNNFLFPYFILKYYYPFSHQWFLVNLTLLIFRSDINSHGFIGSSLAYLYRARNPLSGSIIINLSYYLNLKILCTLFTKPLTSGGLGGIFINNVLKIIIYIHCSMIKIYIESLMYEMFRYSIFLRFHF